MISVILAQYYVHAHCYSDCHVELAEEDLDLADNFARVEVSEDARYLRRIAVSYTILRTILSFAQI